MKVAGIIGYKKSGKTTLLVKIAQELSMRGYKVASLKHTSDNLDLPFTDTSLHRQFTIQTGAISESESAIFFSEKKNIEEMLSYLQADFILIEGFKTEKTYPKIICLRQNDDINLLIDGLQICAVSDNPKIFGEIGIPIFSITSDISKITDLVEQKAFKLPALNCRGCGYETCYEMALNIMKGNNTINDCVALNSDIKIEIDGNIIPLNPFTSRLVLNTIKAMISSLKNYHDGNISIKINI